MYASIETQNKHEPAMKAVSVNGKITKVEQPRDQSNSKMGDHLGSIHFIFFRGRKIRQISQILLISLNYGKTQMLPCTPLISDFFVGLTLVVLVKCYDF